MSTIKERFNCALQSFQSGDYVKATSEINDLLDQQIRNPDIFHLAALNEKAKLNYSKAEAYFQASLDCSPKQPVVLSNFANLLKAMGKHTLADEAYLSAIEIMPSLRDAWLNRGLLAMETLDWVQAEKCLHFAASLQEEPKVRVAILDLYLITRNFKTLNDESIAFQKKYPKLAEGYIFQARGLNKQNKSDDAILVLQAALLKVDRKERIEFELGLGSYENRDLDGAAHHFKNAIDQAPEFIEAHRSLNELYFQTEQTSFLQSYRDALVKAPNSELLTHNLAAAQAQAGDIDGAIGVLEAGITRIGKTAFLQHGIGALYVRQKKFDQALNLFERALELDPSNLRFLLDRVGLSIRMGDEAPCQPLIDRGLLLEPFNQETWAYQGLIWRLQGNPNYEWLFNYDQFLKSYTLPTPSGFRSLQAFMDSLNDYLGSLHLSNRQPLDQSVVNGTQTMGALLDDPHPLIQNFKDALEYCVDSYLSELRADPDHPFLARLTHRYDFSGSWSVRLTQSGHHTNHVHPRGWLSCCSYISLPDLSKNQEGWIKFGETSLDLGSRERMARAVEPVSGNCVFFPSYFWHGTIPLTSDALRTTIPCDIDPVRLLNQKTKTI